VDGLWDVLGYDKVAAQLAEALRESDALNVIEGMLIHRKVHSPATP
jgi:hypothetical protein